MPRSGGTVSLMKPKNFPARKLRRQLRAEKLGEQSDNSVLQLAEARRHRSKKNRNKDNIYG